MSLKLIIRLIFGILFTAILLVVGAVAVFQLADNDHKKSWISAGIQYLTGRELVIGEIVNLEIDSRITLIAADVALNNAAWSEHPRMGHVKEIKVDLELLPLLGGLAEFSVHLKEPDLLLEINQEGERNWQFYPEKRKTEGDMRLYPRYIHIENGRLRYNHAISGKSEELVLSRFQLSTLGQKSELTLDGRYNEIPMQLNTRYESPRESGRLPVTIEGRLGKLSIDAEGLAGEEALELHVAFNSPSLRFIDTQWIDPLPDHGPLSGQFQIKRDGKSFSLPSLRLQVGEETTGRLLAEGSIDDVLNEAVVNLKLDYQTTQLTQNLKQTGVELPYSLPPRLNFEAKLTGDQNKLSLREIKGALLDEGIKGTFSGQADDLLQLSGVTLDLKLDASSLAAVSPYVGSVFPEAKPISVLPSSSRAAIKDAVPLQATARLEGGPEFRLSGLQASISGEQQQLSLTGDIGNLNRLHDVNFTLEGKLSSLAGLPYSVPEDIQEKIVPLTISGLMQGGGKNPLQLNLTIDSKDLSAHVQSTAADLMEEKQTTVSINVTAGQLSSVGALAGLELSNAGPFLFDANVVMSGRQITMENIKASVGSSDLHGNLAITLPGDEETGLTGISGTLSSELINIPELIVDGSDDDSPKPAVDPAVNRVPEDSKEPREKLFSSQELPLQHLQPLDGKVQFQGKRVESNYVEFDDMRLTAQVDGGVLKVAPFEALVSGKPVYASLSVDSGVQPALWNKELYVDHINMRKVTAENLPLQEGYLTIKYKLQGEGNSIAEVMAGLNGNAKLLLEDVAVKSASPMLMSVMEQINPQVKQEENHLECAAVYFEVKGGIASTPRGLAAKLTHVTWIGKGELDLAREQLLITAKPKARGGLGISGGQLASLVQLSGPFSNPDLVLDPKGAITTSLVYGAHVATGGATLLLEGLVNKYQANEEVCQEIISAEEAPSEPSESKKVKKEGVFKRLVKPLTKQQKEPIIP